MFYTDEMPATLSELVNAVAMVEGLDPAAVGLTARLIREAGFISSSGRGRSAAQESRALVSVIEIDSAPA